MSTTGLTVAALRQLLGQKLGRYYSGTAAASGNNTTTVKDTTVLGRYPNGSLEGLWFYQTSGTDNGLWRRVTTNTQSGSTITIDAKPTSEQGFTYELYPFEPDWMSQALRDAGKILYLEGLLSTFHDLVVAVGNSPIADPAFTDWSSTSALNTDFWTKNGSSTVTQVTTHNPIGGFSARMGSQADFFYANTLNPWPLNNLINSSFTLKGIVHTAGTSAAKLQMTDGITTFTSSYHTGSGTFEYLSKDVSTYTTDSGEMRFRLMNDQSANVDWALAWLKTNLDMREYRIPSLFPAGPSFVYISMDLAEKMYATPGRALWVPRDDYHFRQGTQMGTYREPDRIMFDFPLPGEHLIRAVGHGPITVTTTDTDTVEIEPEDTEILLAQAVVELAQRFERLGSTMPGSLSAAKASALLVVERIRQQVLEAGGSAQLPLVGMGNSSYPMAGGVWSGVIP